MIKLKKIVEDFTNPPVKESVDPSLLKLMDEVIDDPGKNTQEYLEKRVVELGELSDGELAELGKRGKLKIAEEEEKEVKKIKEQYFVE